MAQTAGFACETGRRCLLGMGVAASAAQMLPLRAWARAAFSYPAVHVLVDRTIAGKAAPGAVVAVGRDSGPARCVRSGTLAFGSSRAVDENSLWRIYSMTKPITEMAAMLLMAEGRLSLDQPIADFLPAYS